MKTSVEKMSKFDKYDIIMKVLEIVELDGQEGRATVSEEQQKKIITMIGKMEGDVIIKQNEEFTMETGDKFENVYQSVIIRCDKKLYHELQ